MALRSFHSNLNKPFPLPVFLPGLLDAIKGQSSACGSLWLQLLAIETDTQTYLLHLRAFPLQQK